MKNISVFLSEKFQFLEIKFSIYLNRRVFVMEDSNQTAQADLNLRWPHMFLGTFSDVEAHVFVIVCILTLVLLNKLRCHAHF